MKKFTIACSIALLLCTVYVLRPQFSTFFQKENEEENELWESQNKLPFIEEAMRQEYELTKSPITGKVPKAELLSAQEYAMQRLTETSTRSTLRSIQGINWIERGPTNVGGRTRALLFDLNDNTLKKVFAGAVDGGLWICNDITQASPTWNRVNDQFDNLSVTTIAQQKTNPNNMYFGTGEGWFNIDAVQGLGIWRSSDGGVTWQHLPSTTDGNFNTVQKIIVTNNGYVYAATSPGGVMRSKDNGLTWQKVLGGGPGADLEMTADGRIWASIGIFSAGSVWISNSGDPGTWVNRTPSNPATSGMQRIEIATAPSNAGVVYLLGHDGNSNDCNNIWSTLDTGATWTLRTPPTNTDQVPTDPNFTRSQAWYDLIAAVDPNNPLTVIIGGVDLLKSDDAGAHWVHLTRWYNSIVSPYPSLPTVHADQHAIVYRPGSSNTVIFGNDGGIYYTANMSSTVTEASPATYASKNNGYNVTQFYGCAVHPTNPNYFLAGAQDNGSQKFNGPGAVATTAASGGDGAFPHIDQKNPLYQITSYVYNYYYLSTDGGNTFNNVIADQTTGSFVNPTALDSGSHILYADYTNVSTRVGGRYAWWDIVNSTSQVPVTVTNFANASVTHVAVSPNIANRVYFGLANGRVVYVDNANTNAGTVAGTIIRTGSGSVSCIAIEPGNENHMLVTYSNYDVQSVFETTDGGANWTSIEGNLPNMPVRWVVFNPSNTNQAFLATEVGVWSTDNINGASTQWNPTNGGLANCRVDMLKIAGNQMAAATHGRGLFTTTIGGAANLPAINFNAPSGGGSEAAANTAITCDKGYIDYPITMSISAAPTGTATVTLSVDPTTATATEGQDFDIIPKTLSFASGSSAPQTFVVRVYNDANTESPFEFFSIQYNITGTTNAVKGTAFQTFDFRIADDDYLKIPHGITSVSIPSGFYNTNLGGSSPVQGSQSDKKMQFLYRKNELLAMGLKAGAINSLSFIVGTKGSVQPYNGFTILMGTVPTSINRFSKTRGFENTAGFTTVFSGNYTVSSGENKFTLSTPFMWDGNSNIVLQFCYDNVAASPASPVALPVGTGDDILQGEQDPQSDTVQLRAVSTNQPNDHGCSFTAPTIYNIYRPLLYFEQPVGETPVQTVLNRSKASYLGPNEDVYFYDETDGKLLARIQNLSNIDYGCTTVQIDRAVSGNTYVQPFWNNTSANQITAKSFKVLPSQNGNNTSGHYRITLYYTNAEKAGYESGTGKLWRNTQMVKVSNGYYVPDVSPSSPHQADVITQSMTADSVGTNYSATAEFTNATFSGFAVGTPGAANSPLPSSLLSFTGRLQGDFAQLQWTMTNEDNSGYYVEKSTDGRTFTSIGYVGAQNNGQAQKQYSFNDPGRAGSVQYYRISMVSASGALKYSSIIKLQKNSVGIGVQVYPTITRDVLHVKYSQPTAERVVIEVYNFLGARVVSKQTTMQDEDINIGHLAAGSYNVSIKLAQSGEVLYSTKVIRTDN